MQRQSTIHITYDLLALTPQYLNHISSSLLNFIPLRLYPPDAVEPKFDREDRSGCISFIRCSLRHLSTYLSANLFEVEI